MYGKGCVKQKNIMDAYRLGSTKLSLLAKPLFLHFSLFLTQSLTFGGLKYSPWAIWTTLSKMMFQSCIKQRLLENDLQENTNMPWCKAQQCPICWWGQIKTQKQPEGQVFRSDSNVLGHNNCFIANISGTIAKLLHFQVALLILQHICAQTCHVLC